MPKKIAIGVVVLIAALLGYAATMPDTFSLARTTSMKAPPQKIFPLINDFHSWGAWSPYEKLDPAMQRTYSGAANGTGAVYEWDGNKNVGKRRLEITETSPPSKVTIKVDFINPSEGHHVHVWEFLLDPQGASTNVTWAMHGHYPYMVRVLSIFASFDFVIAKDFETGLRNMKSVAEK